MQSDSTPGWVHWSSSFCGTINWICMFRIWNWRQAGDFLALRAEHTALCGCAKPFFLNQTLMDRLWIDRSRLVLDTSMETLFQTEDPRVPCRVAA